MIWLPATTRDPPAPPSWRGLLRYRGRLTDDHLDDLAGALIPALDTIAAMWLTRFGVDLPKGRITPRR